MLAVREPTPIMLDRCSSEPQKLHGIITADCSGAREFDDGISVTALPSATELYQVNVFAVDTSALYYDNDISDTVIQRRETKLRYNAAGKLISRKPMLNAEVSHGLHFSEKSGPLGALIVSFVVGSEQPISEPAISFGQVEVVKNYAFNTFGGMCRDREQFKQYGRAAALILKHLSSAGVSELDIYNALLYVPRDRANERGVNINRAFMIAANHIAACVMRAENRPAIYRTNCFEDGTQPDPKLLPPGRYSANPAPHQGMGLDAYTRITSPLRRAEDFMMHGQLRQRAEGFEPTKRDIKLLSRTILNLNNAAAFKPPRKKAS